LSACASSTAGIGSVAISSKASIAPDRASSSSSAASICSVMSLLARRRLRFVELVGHLDLAARGACPTDNDLTQWRHLLELDRSAAEQLEQRQEPGDDRELVGASAMSARNVAEPDRRSRSATTTAWSATLTRVWWMCVTETSAIARGSIARAASAANPSGDRSNSTSGSRTENCGSRPPGLT
jgi:hypothetical protein